MSTQSAAQVEYELQDAPLSTAEAPTSALKLQTAERLAAHRARRTRGADAPPLAQPAERTQPDTRAARIAAAVAERYAQSQSYRAFLAAEAERAIQQAEAAAEVATRTARAVAAAQQQLLDELEGWEPMGGNLAPLAPTLVKPAYEPSYAREAASPSYATAAAEISQASLTVRLYEDVGRSPGTGYANAVPFETLHEEDRLALDEEIAFRKSPSFEQFLEPSTPLAANLIEFPRQLIASRKARPRLAEGPLREDGSPENAQLRIFEVEAEQISALPVIESSLPEWSSIRLGATPVSTPIDLTEEALSYVTPITSAPLGLRVMSCIVDGCIVSAAFVGFVTVAAYTAGQLPTGQTAAIGGVVSFGVLALLYQLLFFTLSDATPGMRYARIALCTFSDENPSRSAMRRRIIAILLAGCPLGLGFVWAWLDDEHLGWHDRISHMYQRSY